MVGCRHRILAGSGENLPLRTHDFFPATAFDLHYVALAPYDTVDPGFDLHWTDEGADDNASIEPYYDPDRDPTNGNETLINDTTPVAEDPDGRGDTVTWNALAASTP